MYVLVPPVTTADVAGNGDKATLMLNHAQAVDEDDGDPVSFDPHNGSVLALKVWIYCNLCL